MLLVAIEGALENELLGRLELLSSAPSIFVETGTPAGWHPLVSSYDSLPNLSDDLPELPHEVIDHLASHDRISPGAHELEKIKDRLRILYVAGPGAKSTEPPQSEAPEGDQEGAVIGARIPIPAETFIEELSQKLEIHPISIYWFLEEMKQQEGLVCPQRRDDTRRTTSRSRCFACWGTAGQCRTTMRRRGERPSFTRPWSMPTASSL